MALGVDMASIGDGISSEAIEQDPGIAQIQSAQVVAQRVAVALPATGFVASINSLSGLITLQSGTSSPGVTVVIGSDGVNTITIGVTGIGGGGTSKTIITTTSPTAGNDESEGYSQFSQWINTTIPALYECLDASTMAAVWRRIDILPDSGWTAITGTPSKAGFDTSTATLTQVAETLMGMQQALLANGNLTS